MHCVKTPTGAFAICTRISFGVSLLLMGLIHYMTFEGFKGMASDNMGVLEPLGTLWAYILPALMIIGGALFALGMFMEVAAWIVGVALGSIPIGMLLKPVLSGVTLDFEILSMVVYAFVWIIVALFVITTSACCGSCKDK